MIVHTFDGLQSFTSKAPSAGGHEMPSTRSAFDAMTPATYAAIYRTQPNVRTCVDFLARNIAQIGLHAFRRVSDLDRVRLADYPLLDWLDHPNPGTTRFRLFESLMQDLGIYFNAFWLKVRRPDNRIGLVRLPPEAMTIEGWLVPAAFIWTLPDGRKMPFTPDQIVYFGGYDPCDPLMGLSPLETLRQILSEDAAQTAYRRHYWQNASLIDGVVMRPAGVAKWTPDQKVAFREQWQARRSAGGTAVLEDGMTFQATTFSARDSEFVAARKLTREECAAAYHIPLPMVGILDHATFSNIKEQHKQLYQDCCGPWLQLIVEELERQLLPEVADNDRVYLEFNIADKLRGSFEEQASSLYFMVGRPIMTANEGRARLNLPRITDDPSADTIAMPLNTSAGPAAPSPPEPPNVPGALDASPERLAEDARRIEALIAQLEKVA